MAHQINLSVADQLLSAGAAEVFAQLGLSLDANGTPVLASKGDKLSIKKVGDQVILTYSAPCEFYRALSMLPSILEGGAAKEGDLVPPHAGGILGQ